MPTKYVFTILIVFALTAFGSGALKASQSHDTTGTENDSISKRARKRDSLLLTPYHLNVIKFNPTPMMLFNEVRNVTLSYERLIKKNKSVSVQLGYLVVPTVLGDTLLNIVKLDAYARKGINIAFDYRSYPFARNRRPAPDGLYIGGYLSYYGCAFTNQYSFIDKPEALNGKIDANVNMVNLGFEIGYQFIFWKRFSVDLLMFGPSLSAYSGKMNVTGDIDVSSVDEELLAKLKELYPGLGHIFNGGDGSAFSNSKVELTSWFRYSLQFGYSF
jgi:hypothetical protein